VQRKVRDMPIDDRLELEHLRSRVSELEKQVAQIENGMDWFAERIGWTEGMATAAHSAFTDNFLKLFRLTRETHGLKGALAIFDGSDDSKLPPEFAKRAAEFREIFKSLIAAANAERALRKDPKQAAKEQAFKLWQAWQSGKETHKSGAAFARHVVGLLPAIESTKTVERWCTAWRNESATRRKN
jgi:hypothetical protein